MPVVIMSGHGTIETAVQAIELGAYDFIEKPFKADRMILVIRRAIEPARLKRENEELRTRAGSRLELIGQSALINQLAPFDRPGAPTSSRVLISGRPVPARRSSPGSSTPVAPLLRPVLVLNCASMSPERMEVELFGVEGLDQRACRAARVGTFETAHNGTLLLDEVADLPPETQGKIVRVLQEQVFQRVGGETRVDVNVG